jgi:nitroimidazol reductase NimA-like FMN-containing flavoprotein (pyridoxamine 5'-phosphate oxidase superfamily)
MPDEHAATGSAVAAPPRLIVPLTDAECRAVLDRQRLCIVSVVDGAEPYAVPVFYGFDGETLYLGTSEGRKTRALDVNARVYIIVTEVGPGDSWRSVAISGMARTLTDEVERQHAIDVLVAHNRRVRAANAPRDVAPQRRTGGRVIRIEDAILSGRAFGG